jgi:hypothetical protein
MTPDGNPTGQTLVGSRYQSVQPSNYALVMSSQVDQVQVSISVKWLHETTEILTDKQGSGLRIAKVKTYDGFESSLPLVQEYIYRLESGKSSGMLNSYYNFDITNYYDITGYSQLSLPECTDNVPGAGNYVDYRGLPCCHSNHSLVRYQHPRILGFTNAQPIWYSRVTTLNGADGMGGKTVSFFDVKIDSTTLEYHYPLFRQVNLIKQETYKNTNSYFQIIHKKEKKYESNKLDDTIMGIVSKLEYNEGCIIINAFLGSDAYQKWRYKLLSEHQYLAEVTETSYGDDGIATVSSSHFYYESPNHLFQTRSSNEVSSPLAGQTQRLVTQTRYVLDYDVSGVEISSPIASQAIKNMQTKHLIASPIEKTVWRIQGGQPQSLVSANLTEYNLQGLPGAIYSIDQTAPSTYYDFANIDNQGNWTKDDRLRLIGNFRRYDYQTNPIEMQKTEDITTIFIWGYDRTLPIAKVAGDYNYSQIFHTSFEDISSAALYSDGITGNYSWNLNDSPYSIAQNSTSNNLYLGIQNGTYTISFWIRGTGEVILSNNNGLVENLGTCSSPSNGEWQLIQRTFTVSGGDGSLQLSANNTTGTFLIDELRIHPQNCLMTTYTYHTTAGLTSQCDPNHVITYYEYDNLNRLYIVRDFNGNIIERIRYQYHD